MKDFFTGVCHYGVFVNGELMSCASTYADIVVLAEDLAEEYDEDELIEIIYDENENFLDILI